MVTEDAVTRSVPPPKSPRSPLSSAQVEVVLSRSVAIFGALFGLQAIPAIGVHANETSAVWNISMIVLVYASLIVGLVTSVVQRWVRSSQLLVAIVYLLALVTWPFALLQSPPASTGNYWLYLLLTVATAAAAIGLPTVLATVYLFTVPAVYALVRLAPVTGEVTWQQVLLASVYSVILGGTIVVIVTMLRHAASSVDTAQAAALERYAHAVRQHATEVERVQVDSIVHDSVLTTLLSAARAFTPEAKQLAASMAANAVGHLREAALVVPDDGSTTALNALATRISEAAGDMGAPFELTTRGISSACIPSVAAEAVYAASVQAMVNSVQHAGPVGQVSHWVTIHGLARAGIEVQIGDNGQGFEAATVSRGRLGLRVSILERVANAGGFAELDSHPGEGTVVTIRWPRTGAAEGWRAGS